jgi:hypothetical protein
MVKVRCSSLFCIILFRATDILFHGLVVVTVGRKMRTCSQSSRCMNSVLMSTGQCYRFLPDLKIRDSDSSIGIAVDYGLDGRGSISGGAEDFSIPHSIHTGSRVHPAS